MKAKEFILGASVGNVVGAITVSLIAPKSGNEFSADISIKVENIFGKKSSSTINIIDTDANKSS